MSSKGRKVSWQEIARRRKEQAHLVSDFDCNQCESICPGNPAGIGPYMNRKAVGYAKIRCLGNIIPSLPKRKIPSGRFMLAELALAHAQGLNDTLEALPFKVKLSFYLR